MSTTRHATTGVGRAPPTVVSPAPSAAWRELVAADPQAMPTQSPEWLDALCADGRYVDASRLYRTADGGSALLPLARRAHRPPHAAGRESMPNGWGFGGLLSDREVTPGLVATVLDDLRGEPALRIHVRPNPQHADAWARAARGRTGVSTRPACAHVLDLSGGFDVVWRERFRSQTRTQVRRAEQLGVEVETDTTGRLLPELYRLLELSTDRWAEHQHEPSRLAHLRLHRRDPLHKFATIADLMGEGCRVSVAWYQGKPAAAILVLRGRNAHYTRGAMDPELAGPSQANRLLHKVAIEDACRAGCASYHMGESGDSDGLSQFKSRFGAVATPYAEYWVERLPLTRADAALRGAVKRVIGFRDA